MTLEPPKHSQFPPSSLRNMEICPGYIPDSEGGPAAEEGTMLHKCVETGDLTGLTDAEQIKVVNDCLDYLASKTDPGDEVMKEKRLEMGSTFGTADIVILSGNLIRVIDWKFGRTPIEEAEVNLQGWAYACGAFQAFPKAEEVHLHFNQPRLGYQAQFVSQRKDFERMMLRIETVIARKKKYLENPKPEDLNPVDKTCLYCGNKADCPKMHQMVLKAAPNLGVDFTLPDVYRPDMLTDPRQVSRALIVGKVLSSWYDAVKKHATEQALNGMEIPDYDLRERGGATEIKDAVATYLALKDEMEITEYLKACKASAAELKKIISAKAPKGKKGQATDLFEKKLKDLGLTTKAETTHFVQRSK